MFGRVKLCACPLIPCLLAVKLVEQAVFLAWEVVLVFLLRLSAYAAKLSTFSDRCRALWWYMARFILLPYVAILIRF